MKTPLLSFLFLIILYSMAFAQQQPAKPLSREVFGTVVDSVGPVPGVTVKLISATDSVVVASNVKGVFDFPIVTSKNFKITVSGLGYQSFIRRYAMDNGTKPIKLDNIKLNLQTNM